ncbi:glycosyltransferase family 39 protein [bacterium]|nr:glycosyltransferase family 39 protein [bacterium]
MSAARRATLLVFLVACLVYGFGLGSFGLIARGEPRYAAVARGMLRSGDFVTPRLNGLTYLDKPPLLHWMDAASMALFGETEGAFRLPTMLCAALCTALVYGMARRVFGPREALCSTVVLGSSLLWFCMARHARFDMPLAAVITGALWCCWWASEGGRERRLGYVGAAGLLGLGMLTKGPIALVLVSVPFLLALALTRRLGALRHVPWALCLGLFLVLTVPWYWACERANPGYLAFFFGHENAWRLTRQAPVRQPWWHTIAFLLGGILPWTLCVPGVVRRAWRDLRRPGEAAGRLTLLLGLCVLTTIAVYIPPPVKFIQYIIPAVPAVALLIGRHLAGPGREGRWSLLSSGALALLFGAGVGVFGQRLFPQAGLPAGVMTPVWAGCLLVGGIVVLAAAATDRRDLACVALAAALIVPLHVTYGFVGKAPPHVITEQPVLAAAADHAAPGEALVCYGYTPPSALYYYPYGVMSVGDPVSEYDYPGNMGHTEGKWVPFAREAEVLTTAPAKLGLARPTYWRQVQARWPRHVRLLEECPPYVIFETVPTAQVGGNGGSS